MKKRVLALQRAILEGLARREKTLDELVQELGFPRDFLLNILSYFILERVVGFKQQRYYLKRDMCKLWLRDRESQIALLDEINELVTEAIHVGGDVKKMGLAKVWVDKEDEIVLERHLDGLKMFLTYLQEKGRKLKHPPALAEQRVVFFVQHNYGDLLQAIIPIDQFD